MAPALASSSSTSLTKAVRASSPCKAAQRPRRLLMPRVGGASTDLGAGGSLVLSVLLSIILLCYELWTGTCSELSS